MTSLRAQVCAIACIALVCFASATRVAAQEPAVQRDVEDAGSVDIVDANDRDKLLNEGASATEFSLRTPANATCPGDSANDQWRVSSFIIPSTDEPAELSIGPISPEGEGQWALYATTTRPYINVALQQNLGGSGPGRILDHPALSFAVFPPGILPAGRYTIGIACSRLQVVSTYWDTDIIITDAANDEPGRMTWRVADEVAADATDSTSGPTALWVVVGGVLAAFLLLVIRRRAATKTPKQPSRSTMNSPSSRETQ